jgi:hypothetical protein
LYENHSENSLKGDLSNDTTVSPPLFSLVNTFNVLCLQETICNVYSVQAGDLSFPVQESATTA